MYLDFMKLSALIVDDEYSGRIAIKILLEKYFNKIFTEPLLSNNLEDAKEKAGNNKFDICFLDIELNNKSGFDLLPYLDKQTKVIFVTAYSEFAIKAIKEKAYDYLLKPINPTEFNTSIERFKIDMENVRNNQFLSIKDQGFNLPILIADITHIEGNGPYSKIFLINNSSYTVSKTLKNLEATIGSNFIRIHKSYIVNKLNVQNYKKNTLSTNNDLCLPVSRSGLKILAQYF